jgi:hypothetical protein
MGVLSKNDVIPFKAGVYKRIGNGIQFDIEGTVFYVREITALNGLKKKTLLCNVNNQNLNEARISSLRELKNNQYLIDLNLPNTRAKIDSQYSSWTLTINPDSVELVGND